MILAVATAALTMDGIDPAVLRYVVVLLAGFALGCVLQWSLYYREIRENREAVKRLDDILTAAREARTAKGQRAAASISGEGPA